MNPIDSRIPRAFTLIELLAATAIAGILAALLAAGISGYFQQARQLQCTALLRNIGLAVQSYSQENQNEFPRSSHNAWALGKEPWGQALLPYLASAAPTNADETWFFERFRCPADTRTGSTIRSYALNVFFQLGPGDIYKGAPTTWLTVPSVPRPATTVLVAENRGAADHFMCHQWTTAKGASNAVDTLRHHQRSNYLFVDGHVEALPLNATFDPKESLNRWNPGLAR